MAPRTGFEGHSFGIVVIRRFVGARRYRQERHKALFGGDDCHDFETNGTVNEGARTEGTVRTHKDCSPLYIPPRLS